ncbi:hypothetical protein R1flu_018212 [Riccia fluitans]|uniref:Proline-rich protein PRCC n=1 Tax=Riccia fluitans TaxID=41844 RepID=A0ABD1ZF66_9MARC
MDLLANYGSDEEDDEPAVASSSGGKNLFSLPPPRASAHAVSVDDIPVKTKSGSVSGAKAGQSSLPANFIDDTFAVRPRVDSFALPSGFFDELPRESSDEQAPLFSKLPPPGHSTRLSLASLPPPSKSTKKKVEFKPPVNLSLLESRDDDDEEERRKKRSKVSEVNKPESGAKAGGLAALLPPPKNSLGSGLAFGGGGLGGGRRTAMETAPSTVKDVNLSNKRVESAAAVGSSDAQVRVETQYHYSSKPGQGSSAPSPSYSEPGVRVPEGNYAGDVDYHSNSGLQNYSADGGYQNGAQQGYTSWDYSDAHGIAAQPATSVVPDPLAEVLQRERRKGRNVPPPQMIEVKQADLTGGKVREDQLRTTGIAFGPTYQPVSAGKDKPSKLLRRKHQIGALYFDMKSKEMELLDRRSKGNLTKAETQAKYGW